VSFSLCGYFSHDLEPNAPTRYTQRVMIEVHTVDLELMGAAGVVAAYVIPTDAGLIVVDCGPGSTLPKLYAGLERLGFEPRDVKHVLLTHIHLDHAGAAGALAVASGASVYVHRHGAAHLLRPERLMESATRIYGALMEALWGAFQPVPETQLHALEGTQVLHIGGLEIHAVYTPGHAIHHIAYGLDGQVFCGDVGGVRLQGSTHVVAPTPPPDIDLKAWRESLSKLRALEPIRLYPTHFGMHEDVDLHLQNLELSLNTLEALSLRVMHAGGGRDEIAAEIGRMTAERLQNSELETKYALSTPHTMAADGLMRYWTKKHPEALNLETKPETP
jgi:glyoxylase-like metal-dependent hydrolase (beta-lactamase superfamily II)